MSTQFLIGVDGGGTSTRARIVRVDGTRVGEGKAGASGLGQGVAQAWCNIQLAIERAALAGGLEGLSALRADHCMVGMGVAGANNALWRAQFLQANPGYTHLAVDSDVFTALLGAHRGRAGAVVIAGTGSIAHAMQADGTRRTSGGWGFPSGDEGSGSALGLRAVNLAQHAVDGRRAPSALTDAVLSATGATPEDLLQWCCKAGQFDYATLAPLVFDCEDRDPAAAQLLREAVQAMEALVVALDPQGTLPLAVRGSIGQRLAPRLCAALQARVVLPAGDAMDGALQLCDQLRNRL